MKSFNLYVVMEREDGTLLKQRVCKVQTDLTPEDVKKKISSYKKIVGSGYYVVDWYIDVWQESIS